MQKDEIKEIFDTKLYFDISDEDYNKINYYIINLQEENEILKNRMFKESMLINELAYYKLRIDKAIEYIKTKEIDFVDVHYQQQDDYFNGLLNILQGSDKDCTD